MNILEPNDIPSKIEGLYQKELEGFLLVCNPLDMNGVHIIDSQARRIFNHCCGAKSITEISLQSKKDIDYVEAVIEALCEKGIAKVNNKSFTPSSKRPPKKRLSSWFHVTNDCNLSCHYCYINKTKKSMTLETARQAVDRLIASAELYSKTSISIKFAGGEPLLQFPLIREIISYACRSGESKGIEFFFNIITNGTLLSKSISEFVKSEKISISVSLDGVGEYHNCQRDGFGKVEKGILLLRDYGIVPSILVTVTELNLPGLPQLTEYLLDRELPYRLSLFREIDARYVKQSKSLKDFNHDAIEILHECYDIAEAKIHEKVSPQIHKLCDIDLTKKRIRNCGIGNNGIVFGHNGQVAICQALFRSTSWHNLL